MTLNKRLLKVTEGHTAVICFLKGAHDNFVVMCGSRDGEAAWLKVGRDEGNSLYRQYRAKGFVVCEDDEELKQDWLRHALEILAIFGAI